MSDQSSKDLKGYANDFNQMNTIQKRLTQSTDRFSDPPTSTTSNTPKQPRRLQNMFDVGDSEDEESAVTQKEEEEQETVISEQIPKKLKAGVQFPDQLEQRFYHQNPKPPIDEEDEEEDELPPPPPTRKERLLNYLHVKFPSRIVRRVLK